MTDSRRDAALAQASVPTLLMCVAQISGDERWLQAPFLPQRDISIFADAGGGLAPETQQAVRDAAGRLLDDLADGRRTLPPPPDAARLVRMMSVCLGERVPAEYAPMALEEMGFADRRVDWRSAPDAAMLADFEVVVIGAGFSGMLASYRLGELGIRHVVLEKNDDVGGTWYENDYPESGVDTPNHFYSYSFLPDHGWSSNYSKRDEVWAYQRRFAEAAGLRQRIEFGVEAVALRWQCGTRRWEITTRDRAGRTATRHANVVITAVGQLNRPKLASIPGMDTFTGDWWHSARWRHDVPLEGRDVAVIGTGASAMQFLRTVAERARRVTIFQRSPQWARPPQDYHGTTSPESRWLLEHVPYYYAWYRFGLMWRYGDGLLQTVRRDPTWTEPMRSMNYRNDKQRRQLTEYLLEQLEGRPDLVRKCLPDYPPYGKRILIDNHWYRTLRRDNVELVTAGVDHVDGAAIVDESGRRHGADAIVLATGFEPGRMLWPMEIRGRSGTPLQAVWGDDDPRAHLGMTMPDYPNLFVLTGPNTGLAHGGSLIFVSECQVRYVTLLLREMLERGATEAEVRRDVHDSYNARVDAEHAELVWSHPGMRNWYRNARGRVFAPMPWRLVDYWSMTREPDLADFGLRARGR
jgi:4-hydroxyacetophenone monooxygenase